VKVWKKMKRERRKRQAQRRGPGLRRRERRLAKPPPPQQWVEHACPYCLETYLSPSSLESIMCPECTVSGPNAYFVVADGWMKIQKGWPIPDHLEPKPSPNCDCCLLIPMRPVWVVFPIRSQADASAAVELLCEQFYTDPRGVRRTNRSEVAQAEAQGQPIHTFIA